MSRFPRLSTNWCKQVLVYGAMLQALGPWKFVQVNYHRYSRNWGAERLPSWHVPTSCNGCTGALGMEEGAYETKFRVVQNHSGHTASSLDAWVPSWCHLVCDWYSEFHLMPQRHCSRAIFDCVRLILLSSIWCGFWVSCIALAVLVSLVAFIFHNLHHGFCKQNLSCLLKFILF